MKSKLIVACLAAVASAALVVTAAQAFNPATHIYISEHVHPQCASSFDFAYGSIAPDIDQYIADPAKWQTAYKDTHQKYSDLRRSAIGSTQRLFAAGWLFHGEICGADRYAHFVDPFTGDQDGGYVVLMAAALQQQIPGLSDEVAHFAVEASVDLLMQNTIDSSLGKKVLRADLFRSWEDRNLLTRVLVLRDHRTDLLTLVSGELSFRLIVQRYASALALPDPANVDAIAALGAELSQELFGQTATKEQLFGILGAAMAACQDTYEDAVTQTIARIAADPACR